MGRPGHLDQIAAVTKDGWTVLWDLSQRRTVRQWRLDPPPNALSTDPGQLTIPFPAQVWFTRLCAVQNRPFTAEEKSLLPDGADRSMPCRGVPVQH
ncbi:hypothetical protein [Actinacidiphila oryziradicis]|uniref:hypothetical protein n=1 Tax=Actinacidiphila oryziradicis TaxID=2571141 RepID=UPI0023F0D93D|nr:hypothetical protein [Actinacidiphila oryziradicis]